MEINDGSAQDVDETFSPRGGLRIKCLIPVADVLEAN
jgi:hypothetical protein